MRYALRWAVIAAAVALYDWHCDRNDVEGDTLSEATRWALRTHTTAGRVAFAAGLGYGSGALLHHILTGPTGSRPAGSLS